MVNRTAGFDPDITWHSISSDLAIRSEPRDLPRGLARDFLAICRAKRLKLRDLDGPHPFRQLLLRRASPAFAKSLKRKRTVINSIRSNFDSKIAARLNLSFVGLAFIRSAVD
jgi:hypothetical protein